MGRSEARVYTSIWRDGDFLALPPGAQRLYLFLLSQDDLTLCGVVPLREPRWASKAAGLTPEAVIADLGVLEAARFVLTDRTTGELLIRSLIRRDEVWKQWPMLESARKSSSAVESRAIRLALAEELKRVRAGEDVRGRASDVLDQFMADITDDNFLPDQGDFQGVSEVIAKRLRSDCGVRGKGVTTVTTDKSPRARARGLNVGDIVAAYVEGATSSGQPRPATSLCARVGKQARQLLQDGYDAATLAASARTMGAGEWNDLAVQVRKDAAGNGTGGRRPATTDQRVAAALELLDPNVSGDR